MATREPDAPRRHHWPEYLIEAGALGTFMISACVFGTLVGHPASPLRHVLGTGWMARLVMGVLMGLTAIGIIYSPWGRRSGALVNPARSSSPRHASREGARALPRADRAAHAGARAIKIYCEIGEPR